MAIDWKTSEQKQLIEAFLSLETKAEVQAFLRDIMTESEIQEFSKRLEAARLLSVGTQYTDIVSKTGLSSTTVARISKWLKASTDGYKTVIARLGGKHHTLSSYSGKGLSLHS